MRNHVAIRLLSLNIWDLPFPFPGSQRRRRLAHLLTGLTAMDADLVLLQESFNVGLRPAIRAALPHHHADAHATRRGGRLPLLPSDSSGGLLTLSRWPVTRTRMTHWRYTRLVKVDERLGRKGALWTEIETPGGPLLLCNLHTHAGRHRHDAEARVVQFRELLAQAEASHGGPMILAGDLNIDPAVPPDSVSPNGFDLLQQAGFVEVAEAANTGLGTVVPARNRYARVGFRRPDLRRLTHVWYRGAGLRPGPAPATVCFDDPPVSDHFGLLATLELAEL